MSQFNTIHVFAYGETQLIGKDVNYKHASSELTTLQAVIDEAYSKKPADSDASADYGLINIFHNMFVDFRPKSGQGFRVEYKDIDEAKITALVDELLAKKPADN